MMPVLALFNNRRPRYTAQAERLASRTWIAGGDYSIADMAIQPSAYYLERHGFDAARHPALLRWRDAIGARPAARMDEAFKAIATETRKAATPADLDRFFGRTDQVLPAEHSSTTR